MEAKTCYTLSFHEMQISSFPMWAVSNLQICYGYKKLLINLISTILLPATTTGIWIKQLTSSSTIIGIEVLIMVRHELWKSSELITVNPVAKISNQVFCSRFAHIISQNSIIKTKKNTLVCRWHNRETVQDRNLNCQ